MEWLFSLALLPILMCGAMCVGGMALAYFGHRRTQQARSDTEQEPAAERFEPR